MKPITFNVISDLWLFLQEGMVQNKGTTNTMPSKVQIVINKSFQLRCSLNPQGAFNNHKDNEGWVGGLKAAIFVHVQYVKYVKYVHRD